MSTADLGNFLDGQFAAQDAAAGGAPAGDGGTPPVTPPAAPVVETPAAPVVETPIDLDGELPEGDKFDRPYVERLRKEAANARLKAKQYGDVFDQYEDADRQAFLDLAKMLRENPKAAAEEMSAAAQEILKQYNQAVADPSVDTGDSEFMTKAEYARLQQESAIAAETISIENEARELGYTVSVKDVDYRLLLTIAQNETNGDLQSAHAKLEARNQGVIDAYLASKADDANGPKVPSDTAQIPGSAEPIKTFKDARAGLEAYIAQQRTGM
jgi:hypothetical protein